MTIDLPLEDEPKEPTKADALVPRTKAQALVIASAADYELAGTMKVAARTMRGLAKAWFSGMLDKAAEAKRAAEANRKEIQNKLDGILAPLQETDEILETKMLAYRKQESLRAAMVQAALVADALVRAEADRNAQAAVLEKEAEVLKDPGLAAAAVEMRSAPIDIAPIYVAPDLPKAAGQVDKKEWQFTVDDKRATVLAVAAGQMMKDLAAVENTMDEANWYAVKQFLNGYDACAEGLHYLAVVETAIRSELPHKGTAFRLAGVTTEHKERIR